MPFIINTRWTSLDVAFSKLELNVHVNEVFFWNMVASNSNVFYNQSLIQCVSFSIEKNATRLYTVYIINYSIFFNEKLMLILIISTHALGTIEKIQNNA